MSARRTKSPADRRNADLAKIHILAADLGMSDDDYRAMLYAQTGKESAADLTDRERWRVLDHLSTLAGKGARRGHPGRPHNADTTGTGRSDYLHKIEALLAAGHKSWAYADGICRNITRDLELPIERCAFAPPWVLRRIVAALTYQAKREGW